MVPTARTLNVARIASPISTNRAYQPLFMHSLKVYFDSTQRLVKKGDIIAVSLDTDTTRLFHEGTSDDPKDSEDVDRVQDRFVYTKKTTTLTHTDSFQVPCVPTACQ